MKKIITRFMYLLAILTIVSCKHETLPTYSDVDRIYFEWAKSSTGSNRTQVNLGYDNPIKIDSTIAVPVVVIGKLYDEDRPITAEFIRSESSAIIGADVEIMPSFIPAGQPKGLLRIKVKYSEKLDSLTLIARLRLTPNSYFHVDYIKAEGYGDRNGTEFNVSFDAKADMPNLWADPTSGTRLVTYFGPYSKVKLELLCEVFGITRDFFMYDPATENAIDVLTARMGESGIIAMGMIAQVNRYLKAYEAEHGEPLKDENGNEIKMGLQTDR
ncbi:MAG: DUF4843 domain-containing protein [Prevotellaceae bacterium]|jgi:hypothetical protein|nr:DUF4843 domain-containing protein [Prevotellaceae bacterium]